MKKIFKIICYFIYKHGKAYLRERELNFFQKNAIIHKDATISGSASIVNNGDKAKIKIGSKTILHGQILTFRHGGEVQIGDYCYIGGNTFIWSAKKIVIGNRVLIAHNVNIHDQISHSLNSEERHKELVYRIENGLLQEKADLKEKEIIIGDDVWIGFNATILRGVTI